MTRLLLPTILLAAMGAAGCAADSLPTATTAAPPDVAPSLALELSDSSGVAGRDIVVYGQLSGLQGHPPAASFAAAVGYDPAALRYEGASPIDGSMSAVNAGTRGVVRVAGAAPDGFAGGRLFILRFRTIRRDGARSLTLDVPQLGNRAFRNVLPSVTLGRRMDWSAR